MFLGRVTACAVDGTFRSKNQPAVRCHSGLLYKQRYIDTTNTTGTYSEQSSGASSLVFASWFQFCASRNANIRDWSIDKDLRARLRYLSVNEKLTSQTAFPPPPSTPKSLIFYTLCILIQVFTVIFHLILTRALRRLSTDYDQGSHLVALDHFI